MRVSTVFSKQMLSMVVATMGIGVSITNFPYWIRTTAGVLAIILLIFTALIRLEDWLKKRDHRHDREDMDWADRVWHGLRMKAQRDDNLDQEVVEKIQSEFEKQSEE
jgi:hypothetical protein